MTEQQQSITVTKIEPGSDTGWWVLHLGDGDVILRTTKRVRAMGLTLPTPPLTVTIGEHTATINRNDAEAFAESFPFPSGSGKTGTARAAVALADLIRTALEDET